MKRVLLGAASALSLSVGLALPAQADFSLNILHINDFHSRFESITGTDSNCNAEGETKGECFGGIARLKTIINGERQKLIDAGENVVLLNGGDNFQGSLFYTTYKGKAEGEFLNQMGFDAMALGNHEFDDGEEALEYRHLAGLHCARWRGWQALPRQAVVRDRLGRPRRGALGAHWSPGASGFGTAAGLGPALAMSSMIGPIGRPVIWSGSMVGESAIIGSNSGSIQRMNL